MNDNEMMDVLELQKNLILLLIQRAISTTQTFMFIGEVFDLKK